MRSRLAEIVVVTRDLALAHAVTLAAAAEWTDWHQGFTTALLAIGPETETLVVDAELDAPLARLLPTLFVDQREGRRAIVVQALDAEPLTLSDPRVTVIPRGSSLETLSDAMFGEDLPAMADAA